MNRSDLKIEDLLPHRHRMLLIDEILEVDHNMAVTCATVTDRWPFFKNTAKIPKKKGGWWASNRPVFLWIRWL